MNEIQLTQADKNRIKTDIRLTSIVGLLFSVALIVFVFIIPLLLYFLGTPTDGFGRRSLFIIGGLSIPFIAVSWKSIFKYLDLRRGKKINFQTSDYKIEKTKDGFVLTTKSPLKAKFDLYDNIPTLIKSADSITLEITKVSKTLLFISQGNENLLEKIEKADEYL
jgi:hypothetical protein